MAGLHNAALKRPVFSSTVQGKYVPSLANDGSRETNMLPGVRGGPGRCFHTQQEDYPWWAVDLGQPMLIYRVDFTNRGDCCGMTKSIYTFVVVALVDPSQLTGASAQSD